MSDLLNELLGSSNPSSAPNNFVFFNNKDIEGYTDTETFVTGLKTQKSGQKSFRVNHLKTMFDNMALNRRLASPPTLSKEDGQDIIWVKFAYGNTRENLQILNENGIYDFIKDYAIGKIKNVPTFEDLINSISSD